MCNVITRVLINIHDGCTLTKNEMPALMGSSEWYQSSSSSEIELSRNI